MKAQELKKKSSEELNKLLKDKKSQAVNLRMNIASGNVKNVRELHNIKKDVARIITILRERAVAVTTEE
ncbi:MAG: 50S ribosomal protein L29 [Candidatus Spechtbacterales bacterium]